MDEPSTSEETVRMKFDCLGAVVFYGWGGYGDSSYSVVILMKLCGIVPKIDIVLYHRSFCCLNRFVGASVALPELHPPVMEQAALRGQIRVVRAEKLRERIDIRFGSKMVNASGFDLYTVSYSITSSDPRGTTSRRLRLDSSSHQSESEASNSNLGAGTGSDRLGLPKLPRFAYLISGTKGDGPRLKRLLQAVYHPRNYYLLHLDLEASDIEPA
ncbi:hypothetical protein F0562_016337 [Nyssa sinensis]|uniref:Uncharacterized protein n=1 Tax=Nyssa sinensis TaxID=561372 RepID=A0A5J4ZLS9_9ASTE|nr:hypothetical protein F0562_016337 [Nyssa sinensis]